MIVTMDNERRMIDHGYILIEDDRIIEVQEGAYQGDKNGLDVLDGANRIVIPGLINAHTHSFGNLVKGTTENLPLEVWLMHNLVERKYMSENDYAINATLGSVEMLKSGTTTFLDHLPQNLNGMKVVAEQYKKIGARAILTPLFSDRSHSESLPEENVLKEIGVPPRESAANNTEQCRKIIEMVEDIIKNVLQIESGISVAVGPSGPHRCSDELLIASMELAQKYELPWHTHLLESKAEAVTAKRLYGNSMVEHLHHLGILNEKVSFAHGVWVSENDMKLIHDHGSSVVHNPVSNLYLGSGIMPLIPLKEAGVNVALGTDSTHCSGYQSMFEPMKLAAILSNSTTPDYSRWMTAEDILEMATLGSAMAVGLDHLIGSIEPDKKADLVMLNKDAINFVPLNNLVWQLVYGRADLAIESVFVNGVKVIDQQNVTKIDEDAMRKEAIDRSRAIFQKSERDYVKVKKEFPALYEMLMRIALKKD